MHVGTWWEVGIWMRMVMSDGRVVMVGREGEGGRRSAHGGRRDGRRGAVAGREAGRRRVGRRDVGRGREAVVVVAASVHRKGGLLAGAFVGGVLERRVYHKL